VAVHDDNRWISCKNKFLFPVKVVSKLFRGKLLSYTHRIAIANSRILNIDNVNKAVSFRGTN